MIYVSAWSDNRQVSLPHSSTLSRPILETKNNLLSKSFEVAKKINLRKALFNQVSPIETEISFSSKKRV